MYVYIYIYMDGVMHDSYPQQFESCYIQVLGGRGGCASPFGPCVGGALAHPLGI